MGESGGGVGAGDGAVARGRRGRRRGAAGTPARRWTPALAVDAGAAVDAPAPARRGQGRGRGGPRHRAQGQGQGPGLDLGVGLKLGVVECQGGLRPLLLLVVGRRHLDTPAGHALLHPPDDRLDHLDPPVALALRRDHVPGGQPAAGETQHVGDGLVVLRAFLAVAPVLGRQLPGLERIVPPALEAAELFLVGHVHPEFDHDHALFGQRVLEVVDLVIGPAPLHLGGQVLHALDQHAAVPAAIEDGHPTPARQGRPEAPEEVVPELVGRGCREGRNVHVARIERLDQALDGPALAGGVPPLEDDADGRAQFPPAELATVDQPEMQDPELRLAEAFGLLVLREAR